MHLFREEHDDDIADCVRYFNLEGSNAAALGDLPQGDHLLKVGTHKIRVQHRRTKGGKHLTATDSAMLPPPATARWGARVVGVGCPGLTTPSSSWGGRISGPGCSPPGRSGRPHRHHRRRRAAGGVAPVAGAHHRRPAHRRRGHAARAARPWPRWTCPPGTAPPAPVTTLTVFALFLAAAVAVGCGGPSAHPPPRTPDAVSGWRTGSRPAGQPGRSAPGPQAAWTRRGSIAAGLLDVDTAPLAEVGVAARHHHRRRVSRWCCPWRTRSGSSPPPAPGKPST